MNIADILG